MTLTGSYIEISIETKPSGPMFIRRHGSESFPTMCSRLASLHISSNVASWYITSCIFKNGKVFVNITVLDDEEAYYIQRRRNLWVNNLYKPVEAFQMLLRHPGGYRPNIPKLTAALFLLLRSLPLQFRLRYITPKNPLWCRPTSGRSTL